MFAYQPWKTPTSRPAVTQYQASRESPRRPLDALGSQGPGGPQGPPLLATKRWGGVGWAAMARPPSLWMTSAPPAPPRGAGGLGGLVGEAGSKDGDVSVLTEGAGVGGLAAIKVRFSRAIEFE